MKHTTHFLFIAILCNAIIPISLPNAQEITGISYIELTSPVTPALKQKQRAIALDSLKSSLTFWVNEFFDNCLDPENAVSKYFLDTFIDRCVKKAKEKSFIEGRELTVEFTIPNHSLDLIISTHNTHFDSLTLRYWNTFSAAQKADRGGLLYYAGLNALFYSKAHIGSPLDIAGVPTGLTLTQHLQSTMKKILNRIDISFSEPIITGKPPNYPQNQVTITISLDTVPYPNFPISIVLPGGKIVFASKTDTKGNVSLANMRIPFVAHGAFLYVRPDFGMIIGPNLSFPAEAFGLKLTENIDQTIICNIIKPVFTLDYTASSVNQVKIPPVFSEKSKILKLFADSLHLHLQKGSQKPDLAIQINCQISNYTFDEREETQMKVEAKTVVKDLRPGGQTVEKIEVLNDKFYDVSHEIPIGLFFWESSKALHDLIKRILDEL